MNTQGIVKKAQKDFAWFRKLPVNAVIGLTKTDGEWVVSLEAVERKAIPDTMDVLGLYEIRMDGDGNLVGFERTRLRKRGDTEED